MISPHALFIDHEEGSAVLYVQNTEYEPVEVFVELQFGYLVSDSLGGVRLELIEDPAPDQPSATGWIRALPRRAIVYPMDRQAIRLLAQPPADLPDGEYWSRVLVTTRKAPTPTPVTADGTIQVGLTLQTRTILSLNYRKGSVSTAVNLKDFQAKFENGKLVAEVDMEREGNAAYLGNLDLVLMDSKGQTVDQWNRAIAVYYDLFRRLSFPLDELNGGDYQLQLRLSTKRTDIPTQVVLPAKTVVATVDLPRAF